MGSIDVVRNKVQSILAENFNTELTKSGGWTLRHESARLFVDLLDQENRVIVKLEVPLLFGVKPTPELYEYVAFHADDYIFGHLNLVKREEGVDVYFSHRLLGDYLDTEELRQAVAAVLGVSNDIDDELAAKFGGRRFHDD